MAPSRSAVGHDSGVAPCRAPPPCIPHDSGAEAVEEKERPWEGEETGGRGEGAAIGLAWLRLLEERGD
jgi:hypothetical protein